MRLTSRLSTSLIAGVAAVSLAIAYYQTSSQSRAMQRDLERETLLLGESLTRTAEPLVANRNYGELQRMVERFKDRQPVAGIAIFNAAGDPTLVSSGFSALLDRNFPPVSDALRKGWSRAALVESQAGPLMMAALPLRDN